MEKLRKDAEDAKVIWRLRGTLKKLGVKIKDDFNDQIIYIMRTNGPLMEMLGPE